MFVKADDVELRVRLYNFKTATTEAAQLHAVDKIYNRLNELVETDSETWNDIFHVWGVFLRVLPWSDKVIFVKQCVVGTIKAWKNAR